MVLIALAESDAAYRETLRGIIGSETAFHLLDGVLLPPDAPAAVDRLRPDLLLLSVSDGAETIPILDRVQALNRPTKTVILIDTENQDFFVRAVRAGCRGILNKDSPADLLLKCIAKVYEGELWLDRATTAQVLRQFTEEQQTPRPKERDTKTSPLSPREREIVSLVVQGFKNKELAEKLAISEQTVKNHMHNIFDKLGVSDRLELALYAIHNRLLDPA